MSVVELPEAFAKIAHKVWYWAVIRGVIAVIFGVIALVAPLTTAKSLAIVIGIFAIVDGLAEIMDAIRHREYGGVFGRVILGLISIGFGTVVLAWPGITAVVLVYTIALWAAFGGMFQMIVSLGLPDLKGGARVWGVVGGLISMAFATLMFTQPATGLSVLLIIIGIYALMFGAVMITVGLKVKKLVKQA